MFGVNSASKQYQYEIQTALAGIEGQENISDDIIVPGKDQKEHGLRLEKVIMRLKERGLALNAEKCQFSMDKLIFFGMVLSGNGISCTEEKVKELLWPLHTRPGNGIVTLRRLTKSGTPFVFGGEQK